MRVAFIEISGHRHAATAGRVTVVMAGSHRLTQSVTPHQDGAARG
ncbi:hypothetical protein ACFFX0_03475 [Citricoccus parietis]|uniref:Uncharacterized protein n=1 Tax=Citricoccus parietis TaxID=592307 RepID=A0ABV5FUG2_9MICC